MAAIHVAGDDSRGHCVSNLRDVHVVVHVVDQVSAGEMKAVVQRNQIGVAFPLACFLFGILVDTEVIVGRGSEGNVHFVERAIGVAADALEKIVAAVFHQVPIAKEAAVRLHADWGDKVVGRAGVTVRSIGEHVAHVRFVGIRGQQVDIANPFCVRIPEEVMIRIEVEVVTLFGET